MWTLSAELPGKCAGGALYIHKNALYCHDESVNATVEAAKNIVGSSVWECVNVIKLQVARTEKVSLLAYEDFDLSAFPALLESWTIDLVEGKITHRNFRSSRNPPILHRKELLVPPDQPGQRRYACLTHELERRGLFVKGRRIGFKKFWEQALADAGLRVKNHEVIEVEDPSVDTRGSDDC